jgi:hypothetical protein
MKKMTKNFHYVLTAVPAKSSVELKDFESHLSNLKSDFNGHTVKRNRKEIDDIYLSKDVANGIVFDFWSEKALPAGRELQSMRRISKMLADIDSSIVTRKTHVLISV